MKKILLGILIVLLTALAVAYFIYNEKLPDGSDHTAADLVAQNMLIAVNDSAWQQTGIVSWTFMGGHNHLWDRKRNLARVKWKKYEAFIDLGKIEGVVFMDNERVEGKKKDKLVKMAWKYWVNDSFWLNPVSKVFDDGTERSLVTLKDGRSGLRVSYTSGGDTPGDTYVWILDENNRPVSWKMWVSIIPVGGIEVPWNNWEITSTGAQICTVHDAVIDLKLDNVITAFTLSDMFANEDPFEVLF